MIDQSNHPFSTWASNLFGGGAVAASLMGYLPGAAAVVASGVAILWYSIQIYESRTVQRWVVLRRAKKIARMKAAVIMLEAQNAAPLPGPETGGAAQH